MYPSPSPSTATTFTIPNVDPQIVQNLQNIVSTIGTTTNKLQTGANGIDTVQTSVNNAVASISANASGRLVTTLTTQVWPGTSKDGKAASTSVKGTVTQLHSLSTSINDNLPAIKAGMGAIQTAQQYVQQATTVGTDAVAKLQLQIDGVIPALAAIALAAGPIAKMIQGLQEPLGKVCSSGFQPGQPTPTFNDNTLQMKNGEPAKPPASGKYVAYPDGTVVPVDEGGDTFVGDKNGNVVKTTGMDPTKPPELNTTTEPEPAKPKTLKERLTNGATLRRAGIDAGTAGVVNISNNVLHDLLQHNGQDLGNGRWWVANIAPTLGAVTAGGLVGEFEALIPPEVADKLGGKIGGFIVTHGGAAGTVVGGIVGWVFPAPSAPDTEIAVIGKPGKDGLYTVEIIQNNQVTKTEKLTLSQLVQLAEQENKIQQAPVPTPTPTPVLAPVPAPVPVQTP